MGVWGMGIAQSDEFCETYDKFMKRYNNKDEVNDIVSDILDEYHKEFSDDDPVMHDIYFALAKAEWMCCQPSELVQNKVKTIIESDANLDFYRELGASEKDIKLRKKKLADFLVKLQIPRDKPKQRRIDPLDRIKDLPPVFPGECYAYRYEEGYRLLIILDRFKERQNSQEQVCCGIFRKTFKTLDTDIINEEIGYIANYLGIDFIAMSNIKKIATVPVPNNFIEKMWHIEVSHSTTNSGITYEQIVKVPINHLDPSGEKKSFKMKNLPWHMKLSGLLGL